MDVSECNFWGKYICNIVAKTNPMATWTLMCYVHIIKKIYIYFYHIKYVILFIRFYSILHT